MLSKRPRQKDPWTNYFPAPNTLANHPGLRIICFRDSEGYYRVIAVLDLIDRGAEGKIFLAIELKKHLSKSEDSDSFLAIKIMDNPAKPSKKKNRRSPSEKFEDERILIKYLYPCSEHFIIENKVDLENGKVIKAGNFYIITPYRGISLADLPANLSTEFIYEICLKILYMIKFTHSCGIIHGDIKLRNFLLDANKNLSLIDFGDACFTTKPLRERCGTDHFQGPESLLPIGEGPDYSQAWDFYPLGILLMELITGFNPEFYQFALREKISRALNIFLSEPEIAPKGQIDSIRLAFIRLVKRLCHSDIGKDQDILSLRE